VVVEANPNEDEFDIVAQLKFKITWSKKF
jgi:hypothetical protein